MCVAIYQGENTHPDDSKVSVGKDSMWNKIIISTLATYDN